MSTYNFLSYVMYSFTRLMPPGLDVLFQILVYCFFAFTLLGVFYAVVNIIKNVKGLISRG